MSTKSYCASIRSTASAKVPRDIKRGKLLSEVKFPQQFFGLFNVKYSPDGNDLLTCFGQGAIQVLFCFN